MRPTSRSLAWWRRGASPFQTPQRHQLLHSKVVPERFVGDLGLKEQSDARPTMPIHPNKELTRFDPFPHDLRPYLL